ncbi:MAG: hypothetical protein RLZZ253_1154 [Verrucomicrobiota bacterium]|jgi:hypothetical protein
MKISRVLFASLSLLLVLGFQAQAKPGKKARSSASNRATARALGLLDRNHDGSFDSAESERVLALHSALVALDSDRDGKLSESEVAAAKVPVPKKKRK